MFVSLAIWLLSKLDKDLKQPQEYDDPNSIINSILESSAQLVYDKSRFFIENHETYIYKHF